MKHQDIFHRFTATVLRALLAIALAVGVPAVSVAHAATINVACDVTALVAAINTANANAEADTLELIAGCAYVLTAVASNDGTNGPNGLPIVTSEIAIVGNGAAITRDSGAPVFRIFQVVGGGALTLDNLTISGGRTSGGPLENDGAGIANFGGVVNVNNSALSNNQTGGVGGVGGVGGAILNQDGGVLTVTDSTFSDNDALHNDGGAIANGEASALTIMGSQFSGNSGDEGGVILNEGATTVTNSTFSGNIANNEGGGIFNQSGTLDVTDSTFAGNSAPNGGGIAGDATVTNSTFSDNHASDSGGAIYGGATITGSTFSGNSANGSGIEHGGGAIYGGATIANSTFSGNSASGQGGAILNLFDGVSVMESTFAGNSAEAGGAIFTWEGTWLTITNSTFSGNNAEAGGAIYNLDGVVEVMSSTFSDNSANNSGGGIYTIGGVFNVTNTIVANSPSGGNCAGTITDGGGNMSYPDTSCPGLNADPLLGALADNGGPTLTHALLPGSPAIDAADPAFCTATDQRGVTRPQGAGCDIGAFEVEVTAPPTPAELLNNLTTAVNDSVADGNISSGVGTAVLSKLQTAQKKLESGQTKTSVNVLQAFIHSVEAQRGKHISAAAADDLLAQTQAIIVQLQP